MMRFQSSFNQQLAYDQLTLKKYQGQPMINQQNKTQSQPRSDSSSTPANNTPVNIPDPLKEKERQLRLSQNKLKKLEQKFIELFKENKLLKKDWSILTQIIKNIFPDLGQKQTGKYDLEQLKQLWNTRQQIRLVQIEQMTALLAKEKQRIQRQASEFAQQTIDKTTRQFKEKIQSLNKQLDSFKKNSKNLAQQLSDYDKRLESKTEQVSRLTKQKLKIEHQINQMKMKQITDQLKDKGQARDNSTQINQLLGLKHQVSQLLAKRDQLRQQLKNYKNITEKQNKVIQQKQKQIQRLTSITFEHKGLDNHQAERLYGENQQKTTQSLIEKSIQLVEQRKEQNIHHLEGDDDYVHREYMKNVFIRYMKSFMKGDTPQAEVLLNIILTILKFNKKQREMMMEKKKGWWGLY